MRQGEKNVFTMFSILWYLHVVLPYLLQYHNYLHNFLYLYICLTFNQQTTWKFLHEKLIDNMLLTKWILKENTKCELTDWVQRRDGEITQGQDLKYFLWREQMLRPFLGLMHLQVLHVDCHIHQPTNHLCSLALTFNPTTEVKKMSLYIRKTRLRSKLCGVYIMN